MQLYIQVFNADLEVFNMKQALCSIADVPQAGVKTVEFFGRQALVYQAAGEVKAALSICPHLGGPLELKDGALLCPWHGARFDASSGRCLKGPAAAESKAMFLPTRVEDGVLNYVWGE
jgi:nitrite reductase/ring-hydroxylating ferredoxin subunit